MYQYATRYWQADPTDPMLTEGVTVLFANDDFLADGGASSGLPAEIVTVHGEAQANPSGLGREQRCRFRLRFESSGQVDASAKDNRWWNVKVGPTKIHAPRFAFRVKKPLATEKSSSDGNPHIGRAETLTLLPLRTKFA